MHPVKLKEGEVVILKQAINKNDWKMLPTFKLRYLYQRFSTNKKHLQEIAHLASVKLGKASDKTEKDVINHLMWVAYLLPCYMGVECSY